MKLNDLKWIAIYVALRTIMVPFVIIPQQLAIRAGARFGELLYYILPKWRKTGLDNIAAVLPYLQAQPCWNQQRSSAEAIIRQVFTNIGILVAELSMLTLGRGRKLLETVELRGVENFEAAHRRGRGIIGITAHSGNWELMALAFGSRVSPLGVVARTMKKDYFSKALEKIRIRYGNSVIYRDNGVREMLTLLKNNGTVGILPDQVVLPPHGILVDFFGQPCWTTFMPAKLALKTGSAILPFFMHRENGRNIMTIYPDVELLAEGSQEQRILDGTIKINQVIEQHILRYPTQWNWLYRRWKETDGLQTALQNQEGAAVCNRV